MEPQAVVAALMRGWEALDARAVGACLAPGAVWHNMPYAPVIGRDNIEAAVARFLADIRKAKFQMLHQAEIAPGVVVNERVDVFLRKNGTTLRIPVMGCFEIQDGLILAWRDYFDSRVMTA